MLCLSAYESLSPRVRVFLWIVDLVGALCFAPLRLWRLLFGVRRGPLRKILLTRCDGIGDLVLSVPAIRAIRRRFPQAEIVLLVGPWAQEVARMIPEVDRLIVHAPWGYRRLRATRAGGGLAEDWRMLRQIRHERFDAAIDLRGDLLTLLPMAFWGIPVRIGRATRGGSFALTQVVPPVTEEQRHEVDRTLAVAAAVGAETQDRTVSVQQSAVALREARQTLQRFALKPEHTILLAPGAQWEWRRWPIVCFGELGRRLLAAGYQVAIVGGAEETEQNRQLLALAGPGAVDLSGVFRLADLAAAFSLCRAFVAVESGPGQLAAAAGAAGIMLFGPGMPDHFGPVSPRVRVRHHPCAVHPCYQRGDCRQKQAWCMEKITVDEVYQELLSLLHPAST